MEQYRIEFYNLQMHYGIFWHNDKGDDGQAHPDENKNITSTPIVYIDKYFVSHKVECVDSNIIQMVDLNHRSVTTLFIISLSFPTVLFTMITDVTLYQLLESSCTTLSNYLNSEQLWLKESSYESKRWRRCDVSS